MKQGFIEVCAHSPLLRVGDTKYNAQLLAQTICEEADKGVRIVVTPELGLTGYTVGDLLLQSTLLAGAMDGLEYVAESTADCDCLAIVGLPLTVDGKLYNSAAVLLHGKVLGVIAKGNIPTYSEFYEGRYFAPAPKETRTIRILGQEAPFGGAIVFRCADLPDLAVGVEICEDLWIPNAPHAKLAKGGATILCNLSASDQVAGKANYRRLLVQSASARCLAGYIYCDAPTTESTQDVVFSAHDIIAESGYIMAESKPFGLGRAKTEIDVARLNYERRRVSTFTTSNEGITYVDFAFDGLSEATLTREVSPYPFVPDDPAALSERCEEILEMQAHGLARRIEHTGAKCMLLGVSGGLDSTLALLVCKQACELLGRPLSDIHAVTLPCFGTTDRTKNNALDLCRALGVPCREINIGESVAKHLADIGHDPAARDVAYENAQARTRTMVLMDLANQEGGFVVGTGDLSELALGWCTYNGDQMSMYGVNGSVPKTLIRHLIAHVASRSEEALKRVLLDVIDTPISPELLPANGGQIVQKTEEIVGKYDLNDFILYYMMRWGFSPTKIDRLLSVAYPSIDREARKEALKRFYTRFFSQQFKRNPMPDGAKVGTVALSPRGDWRMPSDATARIWLDEIEEL